MNGKTYLIKEHKWNHLWSGDDRDANWIDFEDNNKDFTINGNDISLNIKVQLDALMNKLTFGKPRLNIDSTMETELSKLVQVLMIVTMIWRLHKDLLEQETEFRR
jgi:hypothetical protein